MQAAASPRSGWWIACGVLWGIGALARAVFLPWSDRFLDVDEAVQGLMARHIAAGEAFPLYFYGMNYVGSLEAYLAAALGGLGVPLPVAIKAIPAAWSVGLLVVLAPLVRRLAGPGAALLAVASLVVPSRFVLMWSLSGVGGYMATLFLGPLLTLLWLRGREVPGRPASASRRFLWCLLAGAGLWVSSALAVFLLPILLVEGSAVGARDRIAEACGGVRGFLRARAATRAGRWGLRTLVWGGAAAALAGALMVVTGGWKGEIAGVLVGLRDGTKPLKIALAMWGIAAAAMWVRRHGCPALSRASRAGAAGLALGLLPCAIFPFTPAAADVGHLPMRLAQGAVLPAQGMAVMRGIWTVWVESPMPFSSGAGVLLLQAAVAAFAVAAGVAAVASRSAPVGRIVRLRALPQDAAAVVLFPLLLVPALGVLRDGFAARYLLFAVPAMAAAAGMLLDRLAARARLAALAGVAAFAVYQGTGGVAFLRDVRSRDTGEMAAQEEALRRTGLTHVFTQMGFGYAITFRSGEAIRATPYDYYDLIPRYTRQMEALDEYGYFFPHDHLAHVAAFRSHLTGRGIPFGEESVAGGVLVRLRRPAWVVWRLDEPAGG